jgi:8-amino-7-oxononanoate synthase
MADLLQKLRSLAELARAHDATSSRPLETVIDAVLSPCEVLIGGRPTLMFGSNNYFGLTADPRVVAAARAALERFGSATTGSRIANGTLALHRDLERALAQAFGKRVAAVFTTGYQGNLAVVGALCGPGDFVVLDADCHASLYDAARLSGATIVGFRHNSVDFLARQLGRLPPGGKNRLVVVEGVYSIYGDVAPLPEIVEVCRKNDAYLVVDEAHAFGPYGERGLGCAEAQGVLGEVDFVVGTFSKTLAGVGGFVVSDHPEIEALHMLARPYLFTASGSPANIAGVREALAIATSERGLAERLWRAVDRMRAGLLGLGYRIGPVASPIIPVTIGDLRRTRELWRALLEEGLYVNLVAPPACPPDACLLRMSCASPHTDAHVDSALAILGRVGRELGVVPVRA